MIPRLILAATIVFAVPVCTGFARLMEWMAGACLCRKGAWNPSCPVHGRKEKT